MRPLPLLLSLWALALLLAALTDHPTTFCAYAAGATLGVLVALRGGPRTERCWPVLLRAQILVVSSSLTVLALWRLDTLQGVSVALAIELGGIAALLAALWTRGDTSRGEASLEAWAAGANGGFWVIPLAGVFASPTALAAAVLADRLALARVSLSTRYLRRDAPTPQSRRTALVDYAPAAGALLGVLLQLRAPAPTWTAAGLSLLAPVLALTGAAALAGSLLHATQRDLPASPEALRRWAGLSAVRIGTVALSALALSLLAGLPAAALAVLVLTVCSAPAFSPPQLAVLYGYRSGVVAASMRWGWLLATLGLLLLLPSA